MDRNKLKLIVGDKIISEYKSEFNYKKFFCQPTSV